jgi:hypothetical protein
MKKKQHTVSAETRIRNPTIGTAITTPRFRFEESVPGVSSDRLEGRRDWLKILVGAMSKVLPVSVLKWQL